jgi:hypothetical protein
MSITRQQGIPVAYEEVRIYGFFADVVMEDQVIVEIKPVETVAPVHKKTTSHRQGGERSGGIARGHHRHARFPAISPSAITSAAATLVLPIFTPTIS